MKNTTISKITFGLAAILFFGQCTRTTDNPTAAITENSKTENYGGYESKEKWGEHLVVIGGCGDCHTPKKMTAHGPEQDSSLNLSGHPAGMPVPEVDRKDFEKKGYAVTQTLTSWVGPWGISYSSNLTSDPTGIGEWEEATFFNAIRKGKYKGIETGRPMMPPMPWPSIAKMTDEELSAVFAYLKSTKPVSNVVPEYQPPASAPAQ